METCLAMMIHANIPLRYWVGIFLASVYLISRLSSIIIENMTQFFKLYGKNLDYSGLRITGCRCFPQLRHPRNNKF